ncbi:hypothetical protein F4778DRAFT_789747 [Xylariomycetidae sp. FL2044]|nr:hypothetical protein F4778DRAFT_789747 [Xylariomycetidae sp. FL2044]
MEMGVPGLEQVDLLSETNIKLQLPCNERNFIQEIPCVTATLQQIHAQQPFQEQGGSTGAINNMGLAAYFVRLVSLRKRVIRFAGSVDFTKSIGILVTEFSALRASLQDYYKTLPPTLHLNRSTIYIRRETNQLPSLFTVHLMYHCTLCDLFSIGDKRISSYIFRNESPDNPAPEQIDFLSQSRRICFESSKEAAQVLASAVPHGHKVFSHTWMLSGVFSVIRVLWCHITSAPERGAESKRALLDEVLPHLRNSMEALRLMKPLFAMGERVFQAATHLLMEVGLGPYLVQWMNIKNGPVFGNEPEGPPMTNQPVFRTVEAALFPLNVYGLTHGPRFEGSPELLTPSSVLDSSTPASTPTRHELSSTSPSGHHEESQESLGGHGDFGGFNAFSSQMYPIMDPEISNYAFDTMGLMGDDWHFEDVDEQGDVI